jgi:hypothetical protein
VDIFTISLFRPKMTVFVTVNHKPSVMLSHITKTSYILQTHLGLEVLTANLAWLWIGFSSPQRADRLWNPPSLLSNGYQGLFPLEQNGRIVNLTTYLNLMSRLKPVGLYLHSPTRLHGVLLNYDWIILWLYYWFLSIRDIVSCCLALLDCGVFLWFITTPSAHSLYSVDGWAIAEW